MDATDASVTPGAKPFLTEAKFELHAHLNGSVPTKDVHRLLLQHGVEVPEGFVLPDDLNISSPVNSIREYFKPWIVLKRLPVGKDCLEAMVHSASGALVADGVHYVEFRNSPFNIAEINSIRLAEAIEWLVEAGQAASQATGLDINWIFSLSRYQLSETGASSLFEALRTFRNDTIVGVDLSGDEAAPLPSGIERFFEKASGELGLGVTIHAGETGPPENIHWAIDKCRASRIGHCLAAACDIRLLEKLRLKDICVEVCLTSNLLSGRVQNIETHPVHTFFHEGIPFVLCSDNPAIHGRTLSEEFELFTQAFGSSALASVLENQRERRFKK